MKREFIWNILGMMFTFILATAMLVFIIVFGATNFGIVFVTMFCMLIYVGSYQLLKEAYLVARLHTISEK